MLLWSNPNEKHAMPASLAAPQKQVLILSGGVITVEVRLDTSYFIHCILVAFGGENYGEYARPIKRFAFIAIQYLRWLWSFLGISNSGITVFSSDLLETVVTTTKSQNI